MKPTDQDRAAHIVQAIDQIQGWTSTYTEHELYRSAVMRQLEIIGEAATHLSDGFKAIHPTVPWKQVTGFRNFIVHHYWDTDWSEVERTIELDLPGIRSALTTNEHSDNLDQGS